MPICCSAYAYCDHHGSCSGTRAAWFYALTLGCHGDMPTVVVTAAAAAHVGPRFDALTHGLFRQQAYCDAPYDHSSYSSTCWA